MKQSEDVIIEYRNIDAIVEVRAVATSDGLEVSFMAPVSTPQQELDLIAMRKLDWVRRRNSGNEEDASGSDGDAIRRDGRGGIII